MAIYLAGLAQMTGVDLQAEVGAKLAANTARTYQRWQSEGFEEQRIALVIIDADTKVNQTCIP